MGAGDKKRRENTPLTKEVTKVKKTGREDDICTPYTGLKYYRNGKHRRGRRDD